MAQDGIIGGRYELGTLIGQGGMGDVYHARDTQTGETVAVKVLKAEILVDNPELVERFEREGEVLRKLNHPNIVKMLTTFAENDRHYIVMEYVSGGSLRERIDEGGALPIEDILNIALDLSDALTRAHRLKIIHRDIKPANVLMAEDGTPRLTDFGVARMDGRSRVTQTGAMIGTYAYMSPEACMGEEPDVRTDIWSFGVMLFEMLAGRRPFDALHPAAILTAILNKPLPDLAAFRPDTPLPLLGLVYWMLEKDSAKRIPSVRLVGAQLESLLTGSNEPIEDLKRYFENPQDVTNSINDITRLPHAAPDDSEVSQDGPTVAVEVTPTPSAIRAALPASGATPTPSTTRRETFPLKQVIGAPRIFISYRREDSIAVTGRVYDRLVAAFGEDYVFKDVDKIPVGANFKTILEEEVSSCDVLLAIIGQQWADIKDQHGGRRLNDPNDFVRIEISAGLRRDDILVIPVLVNNAVMTSPDTLPDELSDLAYRNAAVIRNDPDFNHDTARLIQQVSDHFEIMPERKGFHLPFQALIALLAVIIGLFGLVTLLNPALTSDNPTVVPDPATLVEPVAPDEYMVLVSEIVHQGGDQHNITSAIVNDLRRHLEEDVPFSQLRIRYYPAPITSTQQAVQIAEEVGAALVIRGTYDEQGIDLNLEVGSLAQFPYLAFSRADVETVSNVRVQMTDAALQSVALPVLSTFQSIISLGGDSIGVARNTAVGQIVFGNTNDAEVIGSSSAARFNRTIGLFMRGQNETAVNEVTAAINLDARQSVLYLGRALILQKLSRFDEARDDVNTARQLGPDTWPPPIFLLGNDALFYSNDYAAAVNFYSRVIDIMPDHPDGYTMRALAYYLNHDYPNARTDAQQAIALNSSYNLPYMIAAGVAVIEGDIPALQILASAILEKFPDPTFTQRIMETVYSSTSSVAGNADVNTLPYLSNVLGNLVLGQWRAIINSANEGLSFGGQQAELYFLQGFAYCNLGEYEAAEAAFTSGIENGTPFPLLYAERAEVRLKLNNLIGAAADASEAVQGEQADQIAPLIPLIMSGDASCENILTTDLSAIYANVTPNAASAALSTLEPSVEPAPLTPTVQVIPQQPTTTVPAARDDYVVLLAQLEALDTEDSTINRFILRDLQRKLGEDVPFSQIIVREYPGIIRTNAEALQAAEENGAVVVIWGNYTADLIEIEVQIGSLDAFPAIPFDRRTLEQTANVALNMTDPRRESLVASVLSIITVLETAEGDGYEALRALAILDQIGAEGNWPEIISTGLSAYIHRFGQLYLVDTVAAVEQIDNAIALRASNPISFAWRGIARQRLGLLDDSLLDAASAIRLNQSEWAMPFYVQANVAFLQNHVDEASETYSRIIELRPDDWFPYTMRGTFYYLQGDYARARADNERSIELEPNANFPYVILVLISLREGRMAEARALSQTILEKFPDPTFSSRITRAAFGEQEGVIFAPMLGAIANYILEQHDGMLSDANQALAVDLANDNFNILPDLYAMQGVAYCNLGQYAEAEAAYTKGIEAEPDNAFIYVLRADARLKQLNLLGANEDATRARELIVQNNMSNELVAYIDAGLRLEVGCHNFFEWEPPS